MKAKISFSSILIIACIFLFNSCAKDGAPGAQGPPGINGNANVQYATLQNPAWVWDNTNFWNTSTWTGISILSSAVNNTGAVMLYETNTTGGWLAMPYVFTYSTNVTEHHYFVYNTGTVQVYFERSNLANFAPSNTDFFKLVCIPSSSMKKHPGLDLNNYQAVKTAFNLPD